MLTEITFFKNIPTVTKIKITRPTTLTTQHSCCSHVALFSLFHQTMIVAQLFPTTQSQHSLFNADENALESHLLLHFLFQRHHFFVTLLFTANFTEIVSRRHCNTDLTSIGLCRSPKLTQNSTLPLLSHNTYLAKMTKGSRIRNMTVLLLFEWVSTEQNSA